MAVGKDTVANDVRPTDDDERLALFKGSFSSNRANGRPWEEWFDMANGQVYVLPVDCMGSSKPDSFITQIYQAAKRLGFSAQIRQREDKEGNVRFAILTSPRTNEEDK